MGAVLERVRLGSPFVLRSVDPPLSFVETKAVQSLERLGKRIVIGFDQETFLVMHLMIAGRLRWRDAGTALPARHGLVAFDFSTGTLMLTEAGSRRRASLHVVRGRSALSEHDRGGLEVLSATLADFRAAIGHENHTLKRSLTDPRVFSGIGNAYSDEILHRARLSPVKLTQTLSADEIERLYEAARATLSHWIERLRREMGRGVSRESDGVPRRDGGSWPVRSAVPRVRQSNPAHRPC